MVAAVCGVVACCHPGNFREQCTHWERVAVWCVPGPWEGQWHVPLSGLNRGQHDRYGDNPGSTPSSPRETVASGQGKQGRTQERCAECAFPAVAGDAPETNPLHAMACLDAAHTPEEQPAKNGASPQGEASAKSSAHSWGVGCFPEGKRGSAHGFFRYRNGERFSCTEEGCTARRNGGTRTTPMGVKRAYRPGDGVYQAGEGCATKPQTTPDNVSRLVKRHILARQEKVGTGSACRLRPHASHKTICLMISASSPHLYRTLPRK